MHCYYLFVRSIFDLFLIFALEQEELPDIRVHVEDDDILRGVWASSSIHRFVETDVLNLHWQWSFSSVLVLILLTMMKETIDVHSDGFF